MLLPCWSMCSWRLTVGIMSNTALFRALCVKGGTHPKSDWCCADTHMQEGGMRLGDMAKMLQIHCSTVHRDLQAIFLALQCGACKYGGCAEPRTAPATVVSAARPPQGSGGAEES
jgi:hypothetical protein